MSAFMNTKCGLTYEAVMAAIFGKNFKNNEKINHLGKQNDLKNFKDLVKLNEKLLHSDNQIIAYGFHLDTSDRFKN